MSASTFLGMQEVTWVGLQAIIALGGLIVLTIYALDTARIRQATLAQSTANRRPFFTLSNFNDGGRMFWELRNVGSGPALDVHWKYQHELFGKIDVFPVGAVAVQGGVTLREGGDPISFESLLMFKGVRVTYTDTAGQPYWTSIQCRSEYGRVGFTLETGNTAALSSKTFLSRKWDRLRRVGKLNLG